MRIAIFHGLLPGGALRVVSKQIHYFAQNHTVSVFEVAASSARLLPREVDRRQVHRFKFRLKSNLPSFLNRLHKDMQNFISLQVLHKHIAKEIDNQGFDIIIVHPDIFTQAPFLLRFLKTPSVYYCHEVLRIVYEEQFAIPTSLPWINRFYEQATRMIRKQIDRTNALSASCIVANSRFTKMNVDKAYNVRSTICYPGVDTDFFRCQSVEKDIDVLFIGSQSEVDGYSLFLKLKKSFPKRKIISIDRYRRQISDAMLRAYYNRTKIVLCLSAQEPFGLIPLEANACCVPVVARNEGGYRETVIHGKTGLLVNATANDIFRACTILLDDEHKRKMMGLYAREVMLKRWQWQRHGERLEKILYNTIYKRCNEKVATPSVYIS